MTRARVGLLTVSCCCNWGAAVSGEEPEFICVKCPKHAGHLMDDGQHQCRRHAAEARQEARRG
jgi:hypothetical protein